MADIEQVLEQVQQDQTAIAVPILQRDGKPYPAADGSPATISVIGSESPSYRQKRDAFYRARAKELSEPNQNADRIAVAALGVTDWKGWSTNGTPLECTPENVHRLLGLEHILVQVEAALDRRGSFFSAVSAS